MNKLSYYERNKEKCKAKSKEYHDSHKEYYKAKFIEYYYENLLKLRSNKGYIPHPNNKIDASEHYNIYMQYKTKNLSYAELGRKYGVSRQRIEQIVRKFK